MSGLRNRIRFDRNELAGSFGDLGTDLPLIVAMIPAAGLDAASVFLVYGAMQILTGLVYGLPMPVQPLKAMAMLVIAQKLGGNLLFGGGIAIAIVMLLLSLSGTLAWLARAIPHCVVRGLQFGLGLSLASLALKTYVPSMGIDGYLLAGAAFLVTIFLLGNRRLPPALLVVAMGASYALFFQIDFGKAMQGLGLHAPQFHLPSWADITTGFLVLALPQIPLSLSNSVIATDRTLRDLFPEREIGVRKIGLTYALMNFMAPLFGGIPVCHGCGGLAGHYAFGARTGGSVIIYGAMYMAIGVFLGGFAEEFVKVFPLPILGVILLFEALTLMGFVRDIASDSKDLAIALLVAVIAMTLPQGFVIGLLLGAGLVWISSRFHRQRL